MNNIIQQFEKNISLEVEKILKDILLNSDKDITEVIRTYK